MTNIDMMRVRNPKRAGRHLANSPNVALTNPRRGPEMTLSCAIVTTEGDTRGRAR